MSEHEEKRLDALARAIVEGTKETWRAKAMRVALKMVKEPPSRLATGKREVWEDWHYTLKNPDTQHETYELFNILKYKPNEFLKELLKQDREQAHRYEKMMSRAYMQVRLIELILELRGKGSKLERLRDRDPYPV